MSHRATLGFMLYDWLGVESLAERPFHADHNRETFEAVLDLSEQLAQDKFAPFNRVSDVEEPQFDGVKVTLPASTEQALQAFHEAGLMGAAQSEVLGGMQLPTTVEMASMSFFYKASVSIAAYPMLTRGNANTIAAHGSERQIAAFARRAFEGKTFGTMCLSEPQAGSSLGDITTRAVPDVNTAGWEADPLGARYRLTGHKMWISGGEHEMGENIVHLVLAKIPEASGQLTPGVKGISLFIVPRILVDEQGLPTGQRNDIALAGLNHKCGYRGTVNTLLNFGEGQFKVDGQAGAVGYLVGQPGHGLRYMFTLMNEARIAVGLGATMLGYAGFEASLQYAKDRPQGRHGAKGAKDPTAPQVPIIEHADVKRMLLAQKAIAEGGLALALYCARLVDEEKTGSAEQARHAGALLELLTPIAKSWPSEWAQEANSLAIQVLGGYGYTRDFPVEQYWRDNRLNMIHEGTHGIQGLDLLGRKVVMEQGRLLETFSQTIAQRIVSIASTQASALQHHINTFNAAFALLVHVTQTAWASAVAQQRTDALLANATPYMQAFGHVVMAWIWLELAATASQALNQGQLHPERIALLRGKLLTCDYFFAYELPKAQAWLAAVQQLNPTALQIEPDML